MNSSRGLLGVLLLLLSISTMVYGESSYHVDAGSIDLFFSMAYAVGVIGFLIGSTALFGETE